MIRVPWLSVYVPTYRRIPQACCLINILDAEIKLAQSFFSSELDIVEIVISCNEPSDVRQVNLAISSQVHSHCFRIISPPATIPGDQNIISGGFFCLGRHVWILCDDDLPRKGAILRLLEFIRLHQPAFVYLEPQIVDWDASAGNYVIDGNSISQHFIDVQYGECQQLTLSDFAFQKLTHQWLQHNVHKLLRASSIVYDRLITHRYWVTSNITRDSHVLSLALALDAIEAGCSYLIDDPTYSYVNIYENKKSWAGEWECINLLQVNPLARAYLAAKEIPANPMYSNITPSQLRSLLSLLKRYPRYLSKFSSVKALLLYIINIYRNFKS
jgi:hypothetical protein